MKILQKPFLWCQILVISLISGCARSTADNQALDYTQLDVNFKAVVQCQPLALADDVAIFASCTRGNETEVIMSQNNPAIFVPVSEGKTINLVKKSAEDNILTYAGDHNFKFSALLPVSAYDADITSLNADIPSVVEYGKTERALQVAKAYKTSVVAPVELNFKSVAANMVMNVPGNLFGNDVLIFFYHKSLFVRNVS